MKLALLYMDDKGRLRSTLKQKGPPNPASKTGLAREIEVKANLVHKPPTAMGGPTVKDIKIPNV